MHVHCVEGIRGGYTIGGAVSPNQLATRIAHELLRDAAVPARPRIYAVRLALFKHSRIALQSSQ